MGIIYQATRVETGKSYVGQTVRSLVDRRASHERDAEKVSKLYFHRALMKYGFDSFEWEVIAEAPDDLLAEVEQIYIKQLGTKQPDGYNLTDGGEGLLGFKKSPETKQKHSDAMRGKKKTDEHKRKISESLAGRKLSEERKAKMRKAARGRTMPPMTEQKKDKISRTLRKGPAVLQKLQGQPSASYGKLSENQVREIHGLKDRSSVAVGEMFGVSGGTIRNIWRGTTWPEIFLEHDKMEKIGCLA